MLTLGGLLARVGHDTPTAPALRVEGAVSGEVLDITNDSRAVRSGALFCCVRGEQFDGHNFAQNAVRNGATSLLVERRIDGVDVPQIITADSRRAMGHLASAFHDHPSRALMVVGVTGTNGKTTTAHMLGAILQQSGRRTTVLGTLSGERTTPEAPVLQRRLADEQSKGTAAVVMEVSSHALALQRVAGTRFAAAVFTNLGHDHLDFHRTQDAYFAAKASLFSSEYTERGVINRDDKFGRAIEQQSKVLVTTYGKNDIADVHVDASGSVFSWRGARIRCTVGGDFNVLNALAAATTAAELGVSVGDIAGGLGNMVQIPGRFENVNPGGDFAVIVDYAHTPEAMCNVIASARAVTNGQVIVVFGCGGDRDPSKRHDMGAAASSSDHIIVTSDNPRYENPDDIIAAIVGGIPQAAMSKTIVEVDRHEAIRLACARARHSDVVIIAGRGHESVQSVMGNDVPFSDAEVARRTLGVDA
jgi:UDP-N-acetylmuramoyl-L-alanyl-D-glutamate--2,6-diaminopimelate ligase